MKPTEFIVKKQPIVQEVAEPVQEVTVKEPEMMKFTEAAADYALESMLREMATGGASGAGGIAVSMSGPGHKPGTGKPKKIGNAYKSKKVTVGKGVY